MHVPEWKRENRSIQELRAVTSHCLLKLGIPFQFCCAKRFSVIHFCLLFRGLMKIGRKNIVERIPKQNAEAISGFQRPIPSWQVTVEQQAVRGAGCIGEGADKSAGLPNVGDVTQSYLDLLFLSYVADPHARVLSQAFIPLKCLFLRSRFRKEPVALSAKKNRIACSLPPLPVGLCSHRASQGAQFEFKRISPIERVKLRVVSTAFHGKIELVLDAVEEFVSDQRISFPLLAWKWPDHLRPVHARPFNRSIRHVYIGGQDPVKTSAFSLQYSIRVSLVGDNESALGINKHNRSTKRHPKGVLDRPDREIGLPRNPLAPD